MYFKSSTLILLLKILLVVDGRSFKKRLTGQFENIIDISAARYHGSLFINEQYRCAASMIRNNVLLTVAHHVDDVVLMQPDEVSASVLLGASILSGGYAFPVKKISHYGGFDRSSMYVLPDDIAVIHLHAPVDEIDTIYPARLIPRDLSVPESLNIHVTGYGFLDTSNASPVLLRTDMYLASISDCQSVFPYGVLKETNLCAFPPLATRCTVGDAGAGVYAHRQRMLIGIVSYDTFDCLPGEPMIFTKISDYLDYIEDEIDYYNQPIHERNNHPFIEFELEY